MLASARMDCVCGIRVLVHPVALFAVVDSYERRQESSRRVIGSLLGSKEKGVVEIRNAYPVPHNETAEEVAVDMDFDREMLKLHQKVNPNETVVGWYSTSSAITMHSVLIHDYYSRLESNAVFVTMDTALTSGRLAIKAHIKSNVGLPEQTQGVIFTPVPCEVVYFEPERVGVAALREAGSSNNGVSSTVTDFLMIKRSATKIDEMLGRVLEYVEGVIDGRETPNAEVGRLLMEVVSRVPQLDPAKFETMLNSTMQDLLMVVYLANLTKTQLSLGKKLSQIPSSLPTLPQ